MKMFLIVYSSAADTYVISALKKAGIAQYTKMEEVHGEGTETEPKLGTHTWPGENKALFVAVSNEKVFLLTELLKSLKNEHPRAGVRGFILPMEECV